MKRFMDEDFLLTTPTAKYLYHSIAAKMPIFDWHCHLTAKEIYKNEAPKSIYELWLAGDHYKWRAMRSCGIDESYITSDKTPYEKFCAYAKTLTLAIGNPLFHWSHLELKRYFGINEVLNEQSAERIWNDANSIIAAGGFTPRQLIERSGVVALCTTDDPCDSLEYHEKLRKSSFAVKVLPAFRPDKAINIETHRFSDWIAALEAASAVKIGGYADMKKALSRRMDEFKRLGCVAADESADCIPYAPAGEDELEAVFQKAVSGQALEKNELEKYKYETMLFFSREFSKRGFVSELHLGAMRNNNTPMFSALGADCGFDSIDDKPLAYGLSRFLDALERENSLPKTVLFCLNPKDNYVLGTMIGNFQGCQTAGKLQFGSAWWFNDNIDGMNEQLRTLANLGVLGTFVGMVTDSRSFLSYTRHEYFRRILCELIGSWVDGGLYPNDEQALKAIVGGICFENAARYFGL